MQASTAVLPAPSTVYDVAPRGRRQVVDGHGLGARRGLERGGVRGGDRRLEVPRVDDLAPDRDVVQLAGGQVAHLLAVGSRPEVLVPGEDAHPTGSVRRSAARAKWSRTSSPVARS